MQFYFADVERDAFPEAAAAVLNGSMIGAICKGYFATDRCAVVYERFRSHLQLRTRLGDAYGQYLGTFHWGKQEHNYLEECVRFGPLLSEFSTDWNQIVEGLRTVLSARGWNLRNAIWNGVEAAAPIVRSWTGHDRFALIPHEDFSQCTDPVQKGFEVQRVAQAGPVCSLNLCIENVSGGELWIWNHIPSVSEKQKFGTSVEGGPYPIDVVSDDMAVVVPIRTGDLYVFNGAYIHAVGTSASARATISCLVGNRDNAETVMWT